MQDFPSQPGLHRHKNRTLINDLYDWSLSMSTQKSFSVSCGVRMSDAGRFAPAADEPCIARRRRTPSDETAKLQTIDQLGSRGRKAATVASLVEMLQDASPNVRAHAAHALGVIGSPATSAVPALANLLKDADETVRRQAIRAIMTIHPGPKVTVPLAVKLLEEDADPGVRMRVLTAISEVGAKAVPGLIEALKNDKAAYWACLVLRDIGPAAKDAVPALTEKLQDPHPEIRREVILTLAAMDDAAAPAVEQIAAALEDEHTRTAATYALARIGRIPADAEAAIRAGAKSDDAMLRTTSLWALPESIRKTSSFARSHRAVDRATEE